MRARSPQSKARAVGKEFERAIANHLRAGQLSGLVAFWEQSSAGYRMIGPGGFQPIAQGPADFWGLFSDGALSWCIEAKTTKSNRYVKNQLHERQVEHLDATARAGGLALLAIEFRGDDFAGLSGPVQRYAVPWNEIPWNVARTAHGICAEDLAGFEIEQPCLLRKFVERCALCFATHIKKKHNCPGALPAF